MALDETFFHQHYTILFDRWKLFKDQRNRNKFRGNKADQVHGWLTFNDREQFIDTLFAIIYEMDENVPILS